MKPISFVDYCGETIAWVSREHSTVHDADGRHFAWIFCDGVFARLGRQIGYWFGDNIQDLNGFVLLARASAKIEHLGGVPRKTIPHPPKLSQVPSRPTLHWVDRMPSEKFSWQRSPKGPWAVLWNTDLVVMRLKLALGIKKNVPYSTVIAELTRQAGRRSHPVS